MKVKELGEGQSEKKDYFISLLDFYQKKNTKIHIEIKENNRFYNGEIIEIKDDMFILKDVILGEIPIFFSQIKIVEAYKEKEDFLPPKFSYEGVMNKEKK